MQQVFNNIFANSYKYADTNINVKEQLKRGSNTKGIDGAGLYIYDYCIKNMRGRLDIENGQCGLKATVRIALNSTI